jgi:tetratricopeptide (TPR) repeat protein
MKTVILTLTIILSNLFGYSQNSNKHYIKGVSNFESGKYNDAIEEFTIELNTNPQFKEALFKRGICFILLKDYNQAIKDLSKVIVLDSNNVNAYYNRGLAYKNINEKNKAILDFTETIRILPVYKLAYFNRAVIELSQDNFQAACLDLSKASDLGMEDAEEIIKYSCK